MKVQIIAAALAAVASVAGMAFADSPPAAPPDGKALVYIYRPSNSALMPLPASFDIDGVHVASLPNNHYTAIAAPPGAHTIGEYFPLTFSFGLFKPKLKAAWEPGKSYAYKLVPTNEIMNGPHVTIIWGIFETPAPSSSEGFGDAKYVDPTNVEKLKTGEPVSISADSATSNPATP